MTYAQIHPVATDVIRSVLRVSVRICLCHYMLGTTVNCAKTAEPIDMPFVV